MNTEYSYSYNGEDFHGRFASRKEARLAALDALKGVTELPPAIYVGRIIPVDPQTAGHARDVVRTMARRYGNVEDNDNYLLHVTAQQMTELDQALRDTLNTWLERHNLLPAGFHVESISEYPVAPSVPSAL